MGAGPAGLSAAAEMTAAGLRCLVVEQGGLHELRDRHAPAEILSGVGGAGLFSDGKHSFFPSATELWRLGDPTCLESAYERTRVLLAAHGVPAPPFPRAPAHAPAFAQEPADASWQLKRYPSLYASLDERMRCIADLYRECGELPWLSARVVSARRTSSREDGALIQLDVEQHGERRRVEAQRIVVATGRLSPRWIRPWLEALGAAFEFRRLEIGVRLETLASAPIFTRLDGVDPKLSFMEREGTKLLTFCTCRDGEVVIGSVCNIHSVSGRADGPRSGRSSIGLLARITDVQLAREIEPHVFAQAPTFVAPLGEVLRSPSGDARMNATFGPAGAAVVGRALERFIEHSPELALDESASIHAPCIEGVGDYPVSDQHLEVAQGVFVAGDACGRFRGIVASMISGRYVGSRIIAAR